MSSIESSVDNHEGDLVSATWMFELIALRDGLHVDRSRIRRAVDEASQTFFRESNEGWWRWIVEAGESLGRKCRVIDGDVPQLVQLARNGVVVILRSADGKIWHSQIGRASCRERV